MELEEEIDVAILETINQLEQVRITIKEGSKVDITLEELSRVQNKLSKILLILSKENIDYF